MDDELVLTCRQKECQDKKIGGRMAEQAGT